MVEAYEQGMTIRAVLNRTRTRRKAFARRDAAENATGRLIKRIDRARRWVPLPQRFGG